MEMTPVVVEQKWRTQLFVPVIHLVEVVRLEVLSMAQTISVPTCTNAAVANV